MSASLTIVERARGFRPVVLGVVLFWVCVFAAFAQSSSCTWTITAGSDAGDVGYVFGSTASDFCANVAPAQYGGHSPAYVCSQSERNVSTSAPSGAYGAWSQVITGSGAACFPDDDEEEVWGELEMLQAIVGALWLFSVMHGFSIGRVST